MVGGFARREDDPAEVRAECGSCAFPEDAIRAGL
jgi:hypothetical protein